MRRETNIRTIAKGFSWRIFGTVITVIVVYVFFGRLDLAVAAGVVETFSKIMLFYVHEKIWQKIHWGKKKIEPFNLWFTGLPLSGKTTIAEIVYKKLQKYDIPLEKIDSKDIRELIPNIGFSKEERNQHMYRVGHLIKTLQNNSISTIASFVSPYKESRTVIKNMVKNTIVVYVKADIQSCKNRDYKGIYAKAISGELPNFTGISDIFEEPENPEIIINTELLSANDASDKIILYLKKGYIS